MKKKKVIIITGSIVAVLLVIGAQFFADWYKFYSVDKSIKDVVLEARKYYGADNMKIERYCAYTHQKYSKGVISCDINYSFEEKNLDSDRKILDKLKNNGWLYIFDNTESVNKYSSLAYAKHEVYSYKGLTCSYSRQEENDISLHSLQCGGPALREWYPVRE